MSKTAFAVRTVFSFVLMLCGVPAKQSLNAADLQWYRGQLHTHTYWSDGRGFPEQAIEAYKERGYQFLSITDHNRFAESVNEWRKVASKEGPWPPKVSKENFDAYVSAFGKDWVESKTGETSTSVRLKTYAEVNAKYEDPWKFILLPGCELTQTLNNIEIHANYINLPVLLPCVKSTGLIKDIRKPAMTIKELISLNAKEAEQAASALNKPYLFILNHPFWPYYNIKPQDLIDSPEVKYIEICNGGSDFAPNSEVVKYTVEKFWDIVNAFRVAQGKPLLFGVGSDDAHFYDAKRINNNGGVGDAWIMVRTDELAPDKLIAAMDRGDFYASTGVFLDEVAFDPKDITLRVKVKGERGVKYRINFISTKKDFDRGTTDIVSPAEKGRPARTIPVYSDDIGLAVKTVLGIEASYKMEPDDLYVRASIESDSPSKFEVYFHPKVKMAWTQPYRPK